MVQAPLRTLTLSLSLGLQQGQKQPTAVAQLLIRPLLCDFATGHHQDAIHVAGGQVLHLARRTRSQHAPRVHITWTQRLQQQHLQSEARELPPSQAVLTEC